VEATIASGILPLDDGRVPLTCSGDMRWQGNGSRMMYNSQSGQTTLCGAQTKKVVAYKFFQNYAIPVMIMKKGATLMSLHPNPLIDAQKTGRNQVKWWNQMVFWNVQFLYGILRLSNFDSSSHCVLKHPIPMQILKDLIKSWPVDKHGKNVKCTDWLLAESILWEHTLLILCIGIMFMDCIFINWKKLCMKWKRLTTSASFVILDMPLNKIVKNQKRNSSRQWLHQWSIILIIMNFVTLHGAIFEKTPSRSVMTLSMGNYAIFIPTLQIRLFMMR